MNMKRMLKEYEDHRAQPLFGENFAKYAGKYIRPWFSTEIPVGALIAKYSPSNPRLITSMGYPSWWQRVSLDLSRFSCIITLSDGRIFTPKEIANPCIYRWKYPHEKEWKPCGVFVDDVRKDDEGKYF